MTSTVSIGSVPVVHYITNDDEPKGYIKRSYQYACGIEAKLTYEQAQEIYGSKSMGNVNCDWCKLAVEAEKDKPVTERKLEERLVNMQFDNESFSRFLAESRQEQQILLQEYRRLSEQLQRSLEGRRLRVENVVTPNDIRNAMRVVLHETPTKELLKTSHKEAEDEIDAQFDVDEHDADHKERVKAAVREVLEEMGLADLKPVTQTINVEASVDPDSLAEMVKQAMKDAIREDDDENEKEYADWHRVNIHMALREAFELPGFKRRFQSLVREGVEQAEAKKRDEAAARWAEVFGASGKQAHQIMYGDTNISPPGGMVDTISNHSTGGTADVDHKPFQPIIELPADPVVHYRRLYQSKTACGEEADASDTTIFKVGVTCNWCRNTFSPNV